MFLVLTGKRRVGKSYYATLLAKEYLSKGKNVWVNYLVDFRKTFPDLNHLNCRRFRNVDDLAYMRDGLMIIDEAHWKLSSRDWIKLKTKTHEYIAQSGKLHMDILLISHNFYRIDTVIRELVETVRKFHCFGGGYGRLPIFGWYKDYKPPDEGKTKMKSINFFGLPHFFLYKKEIARSYDSEELFGSLLKILPPKQFPLSYEELTYNPEEDE